MNKQIQQLSGELTPVEANPLVSVIIDNYNYAQYLPEAIESVLNQSYRNFELIVVDDGSKDNSREVIESYSDRLNAIFQPNGGQGSALTTGITNAKGQIICFLDADDYFHKDKLAKVVASFQAHPDWVQISHCHLLVDRQGAPLGPGSVVLSQGDVRDLLLQWGRYAWGLTSGLAFRREVLQKVVPIPPKPRSADTYLTSTVPFYGKVGCINETLMFYRVHGKNMQAYNDDTAWLMQIREETAACINNAAAKTGLTERFNIQERDADYRSLKAVHAGGVPLKTAAQIIWLSIQESSAIGRSPRDTLKRLIRRSMFVIFPSESKIILRYGIVGYLRFKFTGKQPQR
ncbi:MAG: glycosyltransferase [Gemmatimonadaceae bacterium]|nr:glycosyltransferase [Gloeobacterales cyanobacterium ES-bin-141]